MFCAPQGSWWMCPQLKWPPVVLAHRPLELEPLLGWRMKKMKRTRGRQYRMMMMSPSPLLVPNPPKMASLRGALIGLLREEAGKEYSHFETQTKNIVYIYLSSWPSKLVQPCGESSLFPFCWTSVSKMVWSKCMCDSILSGVCNVTWLLGSAKRFKMVCSIVL